MSISPQLFTLADVALGAITSYYVSALTSTPGTIGISPAGGNNGEPGSRSGWMTGPRLVRRFADVWTINSKPDR